MDRMYHFRSYYAYVKEKDNSLTIDVNEMKVSNLVNETIQFLGLGDDQFAELNTDLEQKRAVLRLLLKRLIAIMQMKIRINRGV